MEDGKQATKATIPFFSYKLKDMQTDWQKLPPVYKIQDLYRKQLLHVMAGLDI